MKPTFRTIVKFIDNGEEKKMAFPGEHSELWALTKVRDFYPEVIELTFHYIDEL